MLEEKTLTMDELKSMLADTIKEGGMPADIKNLQDKITALEAKLDSRVEKDPAARAEKTKEFVKQMANSAVNNIAPDLKTVTTNTGSLGYTVPTELADAVHEKKDKISKIRKYAFQFNMDGKFDLPVEGTGVTAYWITTEADSDLTEANPTVTKSSLDDYYLASRVRIPYKLINTSGINIENYVSKLSARALVKQEETAFVGGSGSGQPTGLRSTAATLKYQAGANFAYNDLITLFYGLAEQYRMQPTSCWLASNKAIQLIMKLKDNANMPVFKAGDTMLFNKPLLEVTDIPENLGTSGNQTQLWFGDLSEYWIKDGESMISETRKVDGRLQVDLMLYEAVDGVCVNPDAFVYMGDVV